MGKLGATTWFDTARYGLFVHFGLYSLLERGEWVMNREDIPRAEYGKLAERFEARCFDANAIADLAVKGGMQYIVFTTMHHEGFRMYETELSEFSSTRSAAKRDFVAEIIAAARARGLKIGLYHSLNNWFDEPDAVSALENRRDKEVFIEATFKRIRELATRYAPFDLFWYDGWWPFNAEGWRAEEMNRLVRSIQPDVLFNGRNGLPGDFSTPEQHLSAPVPWRPWEACVTLNESWGYHAGDQSWKSPLDVIQMLAKVGQGQGNLLLNIGLMGDGRIPEQAVRIISDVGEWLQINGEAIYETDPWTLDPYTKGNHRADWNHYGPMTAKGNFLYLIVVKPPAREVVIAGLEVKALRVKRLGGELLPFEQVGTRLLIPIEHCIKGLGGTLPFVLRIECDRPASIYRTGGMRVPECDHPRYDPVPSDIAW